VSEDDLRAQSIRERIAAVHWHHIFEVVPGIVTPGVYRPDFLWEKLRLPEDMTGMRVLDIGARDGYFTFASEHRGADVVALDYVAETISGFGLARQLRGSRVSFIHGNLYDVSAETLGGRFDVVLFLGVIYHLPEPYYALQIVRDLTRPGGTVYVESTCSDGTVGTEHPVMLVAPERGDRSWFDANSTGLSALCERAELSVERQELWGDRQLIVARAIRDEIRALRNAEARGVFG
jgi:tRNA (mo5U34)-methyltransferase